MMTADDPWSGDDSAQKPRRRSGYSLLNITNLREPGTYDRNTAVIFLPNLYRPGDEVKPLDMVDQPLRAEVRVQTRASGAQAAQGGVAAR